MSNELENFVEFIHRSPTTYQAVEEIATRLTSAGFSRLDEGQRWQLQPGKSYFLVREGALVAAFRLPKQTPHSALILASHVDSPALKIKPHPEMLSHGIGQLSAEVYGGPLLHSWLDRELILAGRVTGVNAKGECQNKTVSLSEHPLIIPQLAIHLDRSIHEKGILVNKQDHLKAVFSLRAKEKNFEAWLSHHTSLKQILSFDLFLVPSEKPSFVGFEKELIASYRLDNLTSVYANLYGMIHSQSTSHTLQVAFFWDHEEIGSMSSVGADSPFAHQLLERICAQCKIDREDYYRLQSRSLCLSADLAHGFNPNYPEKYDATNAPFLGKGVVLKFNANQKYATNSLTAASLSLLAAEQKIPFQTFASRSDVPCGSTVGPFMGAHLGIPTIDLGIAGWAMHSAREVIAAEDELSLCKFMKAACENPPTEASANER